MKRKQRKIFEKNVKKLKKIIKKSRQLDLQQKLSDDFLSLDYFYNFDLSFSEKDENKIEDKYCQNGENEFNDDAQSSEVDESNDNDEANDDDEAKNGDDLQTDTEPIFASLIHYQIKHSVTFSAMDDLLNLFNVFLKKF